MGPQLGWLGGWAIVVADVIVMANLAQIAGLYTFLLFGWHSAADSTVAVTAVGVVWIVDHDRDLRDRDRALGAHAGRAAGAEIFTLALFAIVALVKVYAGTAPAGSVHPSLSWINPFSLSPQRDLGRDAARGLHLLGLGHDGDRQRGDRGPERGARARRP